MYNIKNQPIKITRKITEKKIPPKKDKKGTFEGRLAPCALTLRGGLSVHAAAAAVGVVADVVVLAPVARPALEARLAGVAGRSSKAVLTEAARSAAARRHHAGTWGGGVVIQVSHR